MPKHTDDKPKLDPVSPEGIIAHLREWENTHLAKIDPKKANIEFGMVSGEIQKMAERSNRRLVAATQGKCGNCGKPVGSRVFNQVSIFNEQTGRHDEKFACSQKCSDALVALQHKAAIHQQAEM
jgi:hypothetical protein